MDFETWFEQLMKEDANPAGLWKVKNVMREAWDAGRKFGSPQSVGAVDPHATSTGKPTPRDK